MQKAVNQTVALQLAQHVTQFNFEDIPHNVVADIKTLILDYLGVALRGSTTDSAKIAAEFQREYGTAKQEATLIGDGTKLTSQAAAFANAVASHSIELDDVDDLALFHFSPPVISAAIAVAEAANAGGKDFITAVVLGCDIMQRLSNAMNPMLRDRGYHTTPVCGVFGAATAAARLEELSAEEMVSAFGLAGAHASGLMEMYGSNMQKRINPGPAAHNGIVAARMARKGYTGADTIFDGVRGVLRAFAGQEDSAALVNGLGTKFGMGFEYKRYACARPIHNAVDCVIELRPKVADRVQSIKQMTIYRHPSWAKYHQIASPHSIHEAQVSLNHAVAVAFVDGDAFLEQFEQQWINHPEVKRLSQMLRFESDSELPRGVSCRLQIVLDNGEEYEAQVDYPRGSIQNPMSPEDHWDKFRKLAGTRLKEDQLVLIRNMVQNLESLPSIRNLTELLY